MTQVSLHELTRLYGELPAVESLDLAIETGTLAALLGPSGCGKSTTLRMIAGLLQPTAGDIRFDGRSVLKIPAERRGAVMVFQKHLLFPHMSVAENVGFGLRMRGERPDVMRRKIGEMLELVQLRGFEARRSHELSGGQQQRVALARALVIRPAVLLLDEPLANLDANLRLEMRRLIREIQQELQMTTLFVTHDQEEAIMLADQVALMNQGRLLQQGSPRSLYEQPVSPVVARFFQNENLVAGIKRGTAVELVDLYRGTGEQVAALVQEAAAKWEDGPVWLTVRPEHVRLAESGEPRGRVNTFAARRTGDLVYRGSYWQMDVEWAGNRWRIHLPGDRARDVAGETVHMVLPSEQIWLMPRRDTSDITAIAASGHIG